MYRGLDLITNRTVFPEGLKTSMYAKYSIEETVDSVRYSLDARKAIKDVIARGHTPIVEGGSVFHHKQIFKGNAMQESPEDVACMKEKREEAKTVVARI